MTDIAPGQPSVSVTADLSLWQRLLCRWAGRLAHGCLTLRFADGRAVTLSGHWDGPSAVILVRRARVIRRLLTRGALGFARAHLDGDWDSPDLSAVLDLALANERAWNRLMRPLALTGRLARWQHWRRRNSRAGSKRNIAFHYDLGNRFYSLWLDPGMTYSAALFNQPDQTLEQAQEAKYARIIDTLNIGPGDQVLEIGCGWGGFAEYAVRRTGCRLVGLTLSQEQAVFARDRLAAAGFSGRAEIRLQDYRDCAGHFDKIVSIEMFEAVGAENWPVYFKRLRQLAPAGQAMIQVITIDEAYFDDYRRQADFIQAYVFPGGMLPSVSALTARAGAEGLTSGPVFRFGHDYERTLLLWDRAFTHTWPEIAALGFDDRFYRLWRYYLHYCAAGFRTGRIDVIQVVLTPAD